MGTILKLIPGQGPGRIKPVRYWLCRLLHDWGPWYSRKTNWKNSNPERDFTTDEQYRKCRRCNLEMRKT